MVGHSYNPSYLLRHLDHKLEANLDRAVSTTRLCLKKKRKGMDNVD
jgi:hypothetical protein